jgi:predicted amidohydrolase
MPGVATVDAVRLLLAAARCEKGAIETNRAVHERLLGEAVATGAGVVVFPEMSLTGSVDPRVHPEHLVALDNPHVVGLAATTAGTGVAVVFGIAERAGDDAFIAQCVARDGRIVAVQRKRHLGEGEEGFTAHPDNTAAGAATFDHGGSRFGIVICAEAGIDPPFDAAADAGARIILFCAAPGLSGPRRETGTAWRAGLDWWESCGLADMSAHARRRGTWVAIATQAGATHDEDFPGLAALIGPDGVVRERLPDWQPGSLVVDVAAL